MVNCLLKGRILCLQAQVFRSNFDLLGRRANLHLYIYRDTTANFEDDVGLGKCLEAGVCRAKRVSTDGNAGEAVSSAGIALCYALNMS